MKLKLFAAFMLLAAAALVWRVEATAEETNKLCAPTQQLQFVCGLSNPEDVVLVPSSSWVIVSGNKKNAGVAAIDTRTKRVVRLASPLVAKPDAKLYPDCPRPTEALFAHGLYLQTAGKAAYKLYVIGHEPEAVHVFDMKIAAKGPSVTWAGCIALPPGSNSVAALKDGTILTTIFTFPGMSMADMEVGKDTGAVLRWRPGDKAFAELPGTRLPGNNGIEVSDDEKTIYVVASGLRSIVAFSLADQPQRLWTAALPIVKPDNIHREAGGTYMIAGMVDDEKACGGKRKLIDGKLEISDCHRGSVAVRMDAAKREFKIVSHIEPDPSFSSVASAVVVGNRIWFGTFNGDRVAFAPVK